MTTDSPRRINLLTGAALFLALASIVLTRVLKLFTLAEILAVAAFLAGVALLISHRRFARAPPLDWPRRLIVAGSFVGLAGLVVKGSFVLLGIGTGDHDMASHEVSFDERLLKHIHHLFFNIGFLFMIFAVFGLLLGRFKKSSAGA